MPSQLKQQLKDSTLIVIVLFREPKVIQYSINHLLSIITNRPNTWVVIINNNPQKGVTEVFNAIDHPQVIKFDLPFNFGKALAANFFFNDYITADNLPKTIVSLDPDTIFSKESFEHLVETSIQCPQVGMLGMRFEQNECNPERNLFFPAKKVRGENNKIYNIKCPFMCTVAGPVLAIQGQKILVDCNNQLFPKKEIKVYGGDDSALYNALRRKYINGYLEGTQATHLFSAGKVASRYQNKL